MCEQNRNAAIVFFFHATVTDRDKDKERERETEKERAERGKREIEREGGKKTRNAIKYKQLKRTQILSAGESK